MEIAHVNEILGPKFSFSSVDTHPVIQQLELPENAEILDVGTGMGNLAVVLALNGYKVTTGEPEEDETIYAKQDWRANAEKVNVVDMIRYKPFDAGAVPFDDASFDAVFSLGTLHHVEEAQRGGVLREFLRVTRPDAVICFFEPNREAISMIREKDATHPEAADPTAYIQDLDISCRKIEGVHFDAFVLQKGRG